MTTQINQADIKSIQDIEFDRETHLFIIKKGLQHLHCTKKCS